MNLCKKMLEIESTDYTGRGASDRPRPEGMHCLEGVHLQGHFNSPLHPSSHTSIN